MKVIVASRDGFVIETSAYGMHRWLSFPFCFNRALLVINSPQYEPKVPSRAWKQWVRETGCSLQSIYVLEFWSFKLFLYSFVSHYLGTRMDTLFTDFFQVTNLVHTSFSL